MLQLLVLGFAYSLIALPSSLGVFLINPTFNATSSDELDKPSPVCVNNAVHPTWGLTLEQFDFTNCRTAIDFFASKLEGNVYISHDFYSRQVYPSGPGAVGHEAWPLAQGAGAGNCALVVRMTRDFASTVLPLSSHRFAPTSQGSSTQQNSWLFILRSLENVFSVCVHGNGLPGWSMDTKNIVVALWPRMSAMNEKYGLRVVSAQADMNASWLFLDSE